MNEERKKWMDGWMDGSTNLHLCETKRHGAREREREREQIRKLLAKRLGADSKKKDNIGYSHPLSVSVSSSSPLFTHTHTHTHTYINKS